VVSVDDGYLLHVLSDSQWVRHWLLFVGAVTQTAVVTTRYPAGFELDAEESDYWEEESCGYVICADSFAEFVWRRWMDNEIFYRLKVDHEELTREQSAYMEGYGRAAALA
jgi:hypothetical protein